MALTFKQLATIPIYTRFVDGNAIQSVLAQRWNRSGAAFSHSHTQKYLGFQVLVSMRFYPDWLPRDEWRLGFLTDLTN